MKLKRYIWCAVWLLALAVSVLPVYAQHSLQPRIGYQVSTLGALNLGVYDGAATIGALKQHGDFGLGTFEGLDGEMVILDGKCYQITVDGIAHPVAEKVKTPFATVTHFRRERSLPLSGKLSYQAVQQAINQQLPTQNHPYAIRIQGLFPYLKVRSVPKQMIPYPLLSAVVSQQQAIFELRQVRGTLVGFRMPPYLKGVNAAGYHFHFITSDRKTGGHLLDGEFFSPVADVETLQDWQMLLPKNKAFEQAVLE